jgi:hypothetical protein
MACSFFFIFSFELCEKKAQHIEEDEWSAVSRRGPAR